MEAVFFGDKDAPSVMFERASDLMVVRVTEPLSCDIEQHAACAHSTGGCETVLAFPESGVAVMRVPAEGAGIENRTEALRQQAGVRFAGCGWVDAQSGVPVVYTGNVYVRFTAATPVAQCEAAIAAAGLRIKRCVEYAENAYIAALPEQQAATVFGVARDLLADDSVIYCHPEILYPTQPYGIHRNQWHLARTAVQYAYPVDYGTPYPAVVDGHVNVLAAHQTSTGRGVVVAVIDDSFEIDHPEFAGKVVSPRSYKGGGRVDANPRPWTSSQFHGTPVSGVAVAAGRYGASGVAPDARLLPIQVPLGMASGETIAQAIYWAAQQGADVINLSLGPNLGAWNNPYDRARQSQAPMSAYLRDVLTFATQRGRGGKGCAVVYAAGNSNNDVGRVGHAWHPGTIMVAACNEHGLRSVYSNYGDALTVSFPSNDFQVQGRPTLKTRGIRTTTGTYAVAPVLPGDTEIGRYTDDFGGTSSAAPGVAGVLALMIAANPALTQSQLQRRLIDSCEKIGNPALEGAYARYDQKGYSRFYGYGRVNAARAVALARQDATSMSTQRVPEEVMAEPA